MRISLSLRKRTTDQITEKVGYRFSLTALTPASENIILDSVVKISFPYLLFNYYIDLQLYCIKLSLII